MTRRTAAAALAVSALALVLRARDLGFPPGYSGDEPYHVPAAVRYLADGSLDDTTWNQPPLAAVLLGASVAALGENPWGWRLRSALLGALTAGALVLLGTILFPQRRRAAVIAGVLLALDPLHVLLSRTTLEEVQAAFFFVAAASLALAPGALSRGGIAAAGLLLGAAHATKAYYHLAAAALAAIAWRRCGPEPGARARRAHVVLSFTLLPALVLLAAYLPWFGRGYGLADWLDLQLAAARSVSAKSVATFEWGALLGSGGTPAAWFVRPGAFGVTLPAGAGAVRAILFVKNPFTWMAVLPALAAVAWRAREERDGAAGVLALLFAATYAPILLVPRPMFLYSACALLPVAFLAVGLLLDEAWRRLRPLGIALVGVCVAASAFLYPLAVGIEVPAWLYGRILGWATTIG